MSINIELIEYNTVRKKYGNTWWGKQWLNALTNIDYSNRLPRGRTYANKGLAYDIVIKNNRITAKVQGSYSTPYRVQFTIPTFSAKDKTGIIEIITNNPLNLSKLLNRELPSSLKKSCDEKDIQLFPDSWNDIQGSCSCPDHAVPCKHMAAVLYLVANEIDNNPFLVFELHDFDLFKNLEEIGYTAEGEKEIHILSAKSLQQAFDRDYVSNEWDDEVYRQLDFSHIPNNQENLLTILSESTVFYPSGDFKKILKLAYSGIAKTLLKKKKIAKEQEEKLSLIMDEIEEVEILLNEEWDFANSTFRNGKGQTILSFDKMEELIDYLEKIPNQDFSKFSNSLKSLHLIYQFALRLAMQSAIIPQLIAFGKDHYKIRWLPALLNPVIRSLQTGLGSIVRLDLLYYKKGKEVLEPIEVDKMQATISLFLNYLVQNNHRLDRRFAEHEIGHLFFNGSVFQAQTWDAKAFPTAIQLWLNKFYIVEKDFVPVIQVDEEESGFLVNISILDKKSSVKAPVPLAKVLHQKKYMKMRMEVLRDLSMLSDYFPQINDLVASAGKVPLLFDADQFVEILFKILPTIRLFGIKVLLPKALRKLFRPQMSMKLEAEESGVIQKKSLLNMDAMLNFDWRIALGDSLVSPKEFLQMVKQYSGIVKLNDQYVFFDENEIAALIHKLENPPNVGTHELLQIALTEDFEGATVSLDKNTRALIDSLLQGDEVTPPKGLKATLRPYQKSGYEWMYKNTRIGFGSLIADDMGLGKTLQVIATLLKLKEEGELDKEKALIVVPTTLLTNWEKEIKKFAPTLNAFIYHGANRKLDLLQESEILITTYGVARSDAPLQKRKWLILVIDEAQNIKNPSTAQTKAIKKLKAPVKIAMSGTPVENRLSEYWSIFDFTNKGYLNTLATFKKEFARPIEADRDQLKLEKFRKITEPFILRRLKSDKSIIKDLPDKIEIDQYCHLSKEQTALYENVVDTTMKTIETSEGIARKGLVLKLITALKQVCNHPRQFLKKGAMDPELSGKAAMLFGLVKETQNNGEKTLIFTQYQEMGKLLVKMLEAEFGLDIPFLHGGVSRKGRDEMVDQFQNNRATRIMILSLKAGGTGLNLTAASNVIHYDLWWNPAVEAQATDRAYRIGQKNNVMVHRFITEGTFEEKINQLLQNKKELANLTVSTGEKWIGEYSNEELRALVKLE